MSLQYATKVAAESAREIDRERERERERDTYCDGASECEDCMNDDITMMARGVSSRTTLALSSTRSDEVSKRRTSPLPLALKAATVGERVLASV